MVVCKEETCGYETRNISKLVCIDLLMTVQRLVWYGVETGAVSRELSILTRQEILTVPYVFVLLLMIQLVMGDYK
jgi:hypothetical protein